MVTYLLDGRMDVGGVGRYRDELVTGLGAVASDGSVLVLRRSGRGRFGLDAPFTPWGLKRVAHRAQGCDATLVHGLHLEVPSVPGIPAVATVHDLIPLEFPRSMPNPLRRAYFKVLLGSSLERAARIIAPSEQTASSLLRRGAEPHIIEVIPIGIGPPFTTMGVDARARGRERYSGGRPYVAAVAEGRAHKNRKALFKVASLLPDVLLLCRGTPSNAAPGNVRFIDRLSIEDLALFYAGAEVLLMSSIIEGYGLPALEAAACGTPVICGPTVGVRPYLGKGVLQADPLDPNDMAEWVSKVVVDEGCRAEASDAARLAAAGLTQAAMAKATLEVYAQIVGEA